MKIILDSFAKLNLYLEVLKRRQDNFHNIKTLFERIDLADKIVLKPRQDKKIKIICSSSEVPKDSSNLAYRSARLLQDTFKVNQGTDIKIIKNIPVAAGLGGGSSNAATVMVGLNTLWKLNLTHAELVRLARRIGSDAPFFLYDVSFAWGSGRGDRIKPEKALARLRLWHVLVVPRIKVSTPLIYRRWDSFSALTPPFLAKKHGINLERAGLTKSNQGVKILNLALCKKDLSQIERALFNSLEEITERLYPEVRRIREKLARLGLKSILMSGSGPAVFGMVSSGKEGAALVRQLKKKNRFWQVFVTKTV